ncbi:adenosylcobalamin-dependent ribonucleoside-diphosphate reductase [Paenibacillus sp. GSMTC-2017]|uniref:adenosylcobalamin-dependent ribonucleoside-diphosphate reductase n=1 Tax=Paenibacillus sp. GSMTC-2017 TaxID=2794350 RepID=UPI0018D85A82|nr:adenosylcobalamin-dependent ribonucleoside-diphosphate reductase [Paenibacillus sp. GSMTC-2017]MBH5316953.1 adenosylcobalamin-dependent ribonucleoside-diphosphate reductase [Paenibacillus sp. GSMTC-2017]
MRRLEGLSEKIFLDRYARKNVDASKVKTGDTVLVLLKEDAKFPVKEVGEVVSRKHESVEVRLHNGDIVSTSIHKLMHPIERHPEEMWDRLATSIASVENSLAKSVEWERKFRYILDDWKLVPGGRIMAGAGASEELTLFNCYVVPSPIDSRGGIIKTLSDMTEIMARGGGVGINISSLRPRRANVAGVNGSSSGAVSWGGLFSYTTGLIEQGGSRRGALMLMMNDWHPDILEFITVKQKSGEVTNANLSVCVSDAFMEAVKQDGEWELVFPDTKESGYDELWTGDIEAWRQLGKRVISYKKVRAKEIWQTIIESAWKSAEPGVVFMERYNKMSNSWYFNPIISTNPCGEQGLPGWGVCNLSAVNLSKFYDASRKDVDWDELGKVTRWSVRFLDNVIDKTPYHFAENEANQKKERRIGLGTMGLAELLIKLNIRYGSKESLTFLNKLYGFMAKEAYLASSQIASEKGSFPAFDREKYVQSGFMKELLAAYPEISEKIAKQGIRNVTVLTQAPTGSTGTMVGTSTGIEPYFAFEYFRQSRLGFDKQLVPIAQKWKDDHLDQELPDYFVSAMELSAEDHIRTQAAIQRWVDSSISKTANCPADFTVEETGRLYELAYELGCKGVTIYRDGSRDVQVLSTSSSSDEKKTDDTLDEEKWLPDEAPPVDSPLLVNVDASESSLGVSNASGSSLVAASNTSEGALRVSALAESTLDKQYKRRPSVLRGATYRFNTPFGMAYITINDLNGSPAEIFLNVGKAGSDVFAMSEALGRVCSLFLRYGDHGNKVQLLVKHLKGIGGSGATGFGANRVESIADAVAKALDLHGDSEMRQVDGENVVGEEVDVASDREVPQQEEVGASVLTKESHSINLYPETERDLCPSCGSAALVNLEGCKQCSVCGFSKCN